MAKSRALGKGLAALIPVPGEGAPSLREAPEVPSLSLDALRPNPVQPRMDMDERALDSLAESIKNYGVVQPLIVRSLEEEGLYEIVAGERRWRAARLAGLAEVPVRVIEGSEQELREISLVENIQREDLSPLEVAEALTELIQNYNLTQEEVAGRIGWSRAAVTNKLRLLQLPQEIKNMLSENLLSEGHCRALLSLDSPSVMIATAAMAEERGLSVRRLEEEVKRLKYQGPQPGHPKSPPYSIPPQIQGLLRPMGLSLKVTGNPQRMKISIEGLSKNQADGFFKFLEEKGEELFPGK